MIFTLTGKAFIVQYSGVKYNMKARLCSKTDTRSTGAYYLCKPRGGQRSRSTTEQ